MQATMQSNQHYAVAVPQYTVAAPPRRQTSKALVVASYIACFIGCGIVAAIILGLVIWYFYVMDFMPHQDSAYGLYFVFAVIYAIPVLIVVIALTLIIFGVLRCVAECNQDSSVVVLQMEESPQFNPYGNQGPVAYTTKAGFTQL